MSSQAGKPLNLTEPKPNILQRTGQRFAATPLGAWLFIPTAHHADRLVIKLSGGRATAIGLAAGLPLVTLTTTGAKSGEPRSVPLVGIPDGDRIVLIASNYGQTKHPAWYFNLRKTPQATITVGNQSAPYLASEAEGAEYDRLWQKAVNLYAGYVAYKERTGGRRIPILILTPDSTKPK